MLYYSGIERVLFIEKYKWILKTRSHIRSVYLINQRNNNQSR